MSLPLAGIRVLVTRASDQAGGFVERLKAAGADVVEFPTIETVPPESWDDMDRAIRGLDAYDFCLFTSANAVKSFMRRMGDLGKGPSDMDGIKLVAVGPQTAREIEGAGLKISVVPAEFKAEGVLAALEPVEVKGRRFLFPRAEKAREVLPERLKERGAELTVVTAYRTVAPVVDPVYVKGLFAGGGVSAVTFTSASTVKNFVEIVGRKDAVEYLDGVCVACIGPVTAQACEEMGITVCLVPKDYTVDALLDELIVHFRRRTKR